MAVFSRAASRDGVPAYLRHRIKMANDRDHFGVDTAQWTCSRARNIARRTAPWPRNETLDTSRARPLLEFYGPSARESGHVITGQPPTRRADDIGSLEQTIMAGRLAHFVGAIPR